MNNDNSISALNTLIVINNDRIAGYETASEETAEQDLKNLFGQLSLTSQKNKQALEAEVKKLGGVPAEGTKTTGKIYRVWMDAKAALTGNDRKAILNSCEYGEDVALDTYDDALEDELQDLTTEQKTMVTAQRAALQTDHDKVKFMRDAL